jgi:hypothetical protein
MESSFGLGFVFRIVSRIVTFYHQFNSLGESGPEFSFDLRSKASITFVTYGDVSHTLVNIDNRLRKTVCYKTALSK